MRRSLKAALVSAAAVTLTMITTPAAFADSDDTMYTIFPDRRAHAEFTSYDEVMTVWDDEKDGRSAVAYMWIEGYGNRQCVNSTGVGTKKVCDFEFAEDRDVKWNITVEDRGCFCQTVYVGAEQRDRT